MEYFKRIPLVFLLLTLTSTFLNGNVVNESSTSKEIDTYISDVMKQHSIPGAALAVVKNGDIVHEEYYGEANVEHSVPVSEKTVFYLFSTTKMIVATTIFQMVEKGDLSLEDKISMHLDDLPKPWQNVKIKHLLSYSSGLPQIQFEKSEELAKQKTYKKDLEYKPGEHWSYSQTNYWLLKRIIEEKTRSPFEQYVNDSQFESDKRVRFSSNSYEIIPHRTSIYKAENPRRTQEITLYHAEPYFHVSNGLNSNLNSLIEWNRKLDIGNFISRKTKSKMWSKFDYSKSNRQFTYGWDIHRVNQFNSYGFTGGGVSGIRKFPDKGLTIILLSNGYKYIPIPNRIIDHVAGIVDEDLINKDGLFNEELLTTFFSKSISEAVAKFKTSRKLNPAANIEQTMNSIGYSLANKKRYRDAIEVFRLNVKEYPTSANVWDSLGEGYEMAGDNENAIKYYKKSLELNKNNRHAADKIKTLKKATP